MDDRLRQSSYVQAAGRAIEKGFGKDAGVQPRRRDRSRSSPRSRRSSGCRRCSSASACRTRTRTHPTRSSIWATSTAASSRPRICTTKSERLTEDAPASRRRSRRLRRVSADARIRPPIREGDDEADLRQGPPASCPGTDLRSPTATAVIDTWTDMDGGEPAAVAHRPQRGRPSRSLGVLRRGRASSLKVGFSRQRRRQAGRVGGCRAPTGEIARVEVSSKGDEKPGSIAGRSTTAPIPSSDCRGRRGHER